MNRMRLHRSDTMLGGDRAVVARWRDEQNENFVRNGRDGIRGIKCEERCKARTDELVDEGFQRSLYFGRILRRDNIQMQISCPNPIHQCLSKKRNTTPSVIRTHRPQHVHTQ